MNAQALIFNKNNEVLMVQQYVSRGALVWNFPGGNIEENETPEEACIREVREETGYNIKIIRSIMKNEKLFTFLGEIIDGVLFLDNRETELVDNGWISLEDKEKWDKITLEVLETYYKEC